MTLKVISWNIWGGKNREKVIEFLKKKDFDVIAFQEVTVREVDEKLVNDAQEVANALGLHIAYGKAFTTDRHFPQYEMGNAVLSKYPIIETLVHPLSGMEMYEKNAASEPRNAVEVIISVEKTNVHVFSTHLGYSDTLQATAIQLQQVKKLLKILPDSKGVLMGDFNSEPTSEVVTHVLGKMNHSADDLSQISWINMKKENRPRHRIDYIFTTNDIKVRDSTIYESDASDHRPLYAGIEV